MGELFTVLFLLVVIWLYFLPIIIAFKRGHHNRWPIFLVWFIFSWTVVGWFVALIWAYTKPAPVTITSS
jgi:hypothetical protein